MAARAASWLATAAVLALAALGLLHASSAFVSAGAPTATGRLRGIAAAPGMGSARSSTVGVGAAAAGPSAALLALPLAGACVAAAALRARGAATALRVTTRTEWYRKVKRVGGDKAIFDVSIPKPMGVKMEKFPQRRGIGISEVVDGGNTDKLNRKVCVDDEPGSGMWVLEGDMVLAVNGENVEEGTIEDVVKIVSASDSNEVTLTLLRNTRKGPIKVVLLPEGFAMTVRRNSRLSAAAEAAAGKELKYGCIDGWCGTCWHRERTTNGIFKPCCDVITGDWDNVMPLVITPKPEKAGDSTLLNPRGV